MRTGTLMATVLMLGTVALSGCPKRPDMVQAPPAPPGPKATAPAVQQPEVAVTRPAPVPAPAEPTPALTTSVPEPLNDIFFAFDDARILSAQQTALQRNFAYLEAHPEARVTIEGIATNGGRRSTTSAWASGGQRWLKRPSRPRGSPPTGSTRSGTARIVHLSSATTKTRGG